MVSHSDRRSNKATNLITNDNVAVKVGQYMACAKTLIMEVTMLLMIRSFRDYLYFIIRGCIWTCMICKNQHKKNDDEYYDGYHPR